MHTCAYQCTICVTRGTSNVPIRHILYDINADRATRCASEADTVRQPGSVSCRAATRVALYACRATRARTKKSAPTPTINPATQAAATLNYQVLRNSGTIITQVTKPTTRERSRSRLNTACVCKQRNFYFQTGMPAKGELSTTRVV